MEQATVVPCYGLLGLSLPLFEVELKLSDGPGPCSPRFLPSHIRDMFEYPRERLEQLAFVGEYPNQVKRSDYAWGLVARLADKVHVGRSLDESPLLVPNEDDDVSEGSDWEIDEDDYLDEEYDEDAGIYDYYDPYDYYDGGYDLDWL